VNISKKKIIALIPARSGSQRIKNKNIIRLNKHPLIAYTILAAKQSKLFDKILVSTDSKKYQKIARYYGAYVPFLRPKKISKSTSPDYDWVKHALDFLKKKENLTYDFFFILRPTNPFRTKKTIINAWKKFKKNKKIESLRAVEICNQHPGKMWLIKNQLIKPLLNLRINKQPSYNNQKKALPNVYIQNASLEISKVSVVKKFKTITGTKIIPYFTRYPEGYDINEKNDLKIDKNLLKKITFIKEKPY
jgi:CMP-N,N'-diacetyllegionaminic acid synthase